MARAHSPSSPGDLQDFWLEIHDIENSKDPETEDEDHAKTPDEGEQEAAWLQEAGYGFLVNKYQDGKELQDEEIHALTSLLPAQHAAVVRRRVDTLNATLRKKQKYTTKIDVRNIFPQQSHGTVVQQSEIVDTPPAHTKQQSTVTRPTSLNTSSQHVWIKQSSPLSSPVSPRVFTFPKLSPLCEPHLDPDSVRSHQYLLSHSLSDVFDRTPDSTPDCSFDDNADRTSLDRLSSQSETESPLTSPSRSKSSSCDTLGSLDSGLDSSTSIATRGQFGSHDSISTSRSEKHESNIPTTSNQETGYIYQVGEFSSRKPDPETPLSPSDPINPLIRPRLDSTDDDSIPILVAFRQRRLGYSLDEISPRSPTTNKFVNNILIETPRSPVSPKREVIHPEWSNVRRNGAAKGRERPASFLKNRGGYSMSGVTEEVQDNVQLGVETLSVQPKGTFLRSHSNSSTNHSEQNSPVLSISDTDITFDFNVEENHNSQENTKNTSIKSLHTDTLPTFNLVNDKLGITYVRDLSDQDLANVRSLALLELTTIFDAHSITYSRRRSKRKHKEHGLFGVSLQSLLDGDQKRKENTKVPLIFSEIVNYLIKHCLDSEGILRIPGSTSRIKQLRQELDDKFYHGSFIWADDVTPNDVAALMKQFLRELPTPLLTDEYIEAFAQVERVPDRTQQLHALNLLILLLPDVNRNTLNMLLDFLSRVIAQSSLNKMSLNNVAMIMAPNLFLAPNIRASQKSKSKSAWELEMAAGTSNIMRMMIKYHNILYTIPLMPHLRRQYELEQIRRNRDRTKMKFLAKKDKTEVYKKPALIHESDFQEGVIRIQAPGLTKSSTAIQLDDEMTSGDIVAKFRAIQGSQTWDARKCAEMNQSPSAVFSDPKNFTFAGADTYLYEVGGNIVERCLSHKTNMMALYKVNPNAEWIIKQRRGNYS